MIGGENAKRRGFTLIESLVAASLFVIAVTSATGLFVTYTRTQKESGLRQQALNQLSLELDKLAQDIRINKISFSGGAGFRPGNLYTYDEAAGVPNEDPEITSYEYELGLTTGEVYFYYHNNTTLSCSGASEKSLLYQYTSTGFCNPVFLIPGVTLTDVKFYIHPSYKPYPQSNADCKSGNPFNGYYCECPTNNNSECYSGLCSDGLCLESQPSVTISMTAQIAAGANVTLQTTVSSRVYQ